MNAVARRSCRRVLALALALGLTAGRAIAEDPAPAGHPAPAVAFGGRFGDKAVLVIGGVPRTVAVGATVGGVTLLRLDGDAALIEVGGQRRRIDLAGQSSTGASRAAPTIVLSAGSGGHFWANGTINGQSVRFMVDTGATNVSMSVEMAQRLGVKLGAGRASLSATANGTVMTETVSLDAVRVGDVEIYHVTASVVPASMDYVLLGNSFLGRFRMTRDDQELTLTRRY